MDGGIYLVRFKDSGEVVKVVRWGEDTVTIIRGDGTIECVRIGDVVAVVDAHFSATMAQIAEAAERSKIITQFARSSE